MVCGTKTQIKFISAVFLSVNICREACNTYVRTKLSTLSLKLYQFRIKKTGATAWEKPQIRSMVDLGLGRPDARLKRAALW